MGLKEVRKLDELNRVVIPKAIANKLHLQPGELLILEEDGVGIHLTRLDEHCRICGGTEYLKVIGEQKICNECLRKLRMYLEGLN